DLPAGERERTMRNLERFRSLLDRVDDPYPLMGEFMSRVRAAFEDGRLEKHEVEELNLFLEQTIEESGVPVMQLGSKIRNEELGMRNAALLPVTPEKAALRHELSEISVHGPAPGFGRRSNGGGWSGIPNS
ncbi:MAG TPA: hypothetical protein VLT81_03240, partial [Chondromyces sp.]|nr:hypothetical protein [Chondromyces sp.]